MLSFAIFATPVFCQGLLPDIQEVIPDHLQIQNEHQREMLRFTTGHVNLGQGPLQILGGGQVAPCVIEGVTYNQCTVASQQILDGNGNVVATHPAGLAFFHPEHNHWHQSDVAQFEIRLGALDGPALVAGTKVTFCLVDLEPIEGVKTTQSRTYWECNGNLQGISPGWADVYHHSTEGQELDITGAPDGTYYLTHLANPAGNWIESSYANNFAWVKFRLSRKGGNPEIQILEHSSCVEGQTCPSPGNK